MTKSTLTTTALAGVAALVLAACGSDAGSETNDDTVEATGAEDAGDDHDDHDHDHEDEDHDHDHDHEGETGDGHDHDDHDDHDHGDDEDEDHDHDHEGHGHGGGNASEAPGPSPRLAVTYDGGVMVVDAMTLEVVADLEAEGVTRAAPAGDGRHLFLVDEAGFRLLDAATWSEPHGNHDHSYVGDPVLTDLTVEGEGAGHVVTHGDRTALYFDGAGRIDVLDPAELDAGSDHLHLEESVEVDEPHHGVAVPLTDGGLLESITGGDGVVGVRALDADGEEIASSEDCPGLHGEGSGGEAVTFGCQGGVLVFQDGEFTSIDAPDAEGRISTMTDHADSPVVLGNYSTDPEADRVNVSLTDTEAGSMEVVELDAAYGALARGPEGEGLALGVDGVVRVIDVTSGEVTDEIDVMDAWTPPSGHHDPQPSLFAMGQFGYVVDPETSTLHVIDLAGGEVVDSAELPQVPTSLSGVSGHYDH